MYADSALLAEYTIHVHPVHRLEILGLKTRMKVGNDPVPFGIAGYDDNDNEFDTLDGLQISWYAREREHRSWQLYNWVNILKVHGNLFPCYSVIERTYY
jgi:hypothetical protein